MRSAKAGHVMSWVLSVLQFSPGPVRCILLSRVSVLQHAERDTVMQFMSIRLSVMLYFCLLQRSHGDSLSYLFDVPVYVLVAALQLVRPRPYLKFIFGQCFPFPAFIRN